MRHIAGSLWVAIATTWLTTTAIAADSPHFGSWGLDLSAMDTTVRPGEDFNRYASGAWLARTEIPADKSIISLRVLQSDAITAQVHDLLEAAHAHADPATLEGKAGAFYAAFMDEARVEALGSKPIDGELAAINAARDRAALARLMGQSQAGFYASIFGVSVDIDLKNVRAYAISLTQGGLGLPDRDYYLEPSFATQKSAYQAYVGKLLSLLGWQHSEIAAAGVVEFETRIAKFSWTEAEQRDLVKTYNAMTLAQLNALTPGFAWSAFLDGAALGAEQRLIVHEKSAFAKIAALYQSTPLSVLKAWQAFTVADNAAVYLSEPFAAARFEFRDHQLLGQPVEQPRWQRAVRAVGSDCHGERTECFGNIGYAVGQIYVARYFSPESKAKIEALVRNVKAAMHERLEHLNWMSETTRSEALSKLDTYQIKVGYPDHPRTYAGLEIRADDLVGDVRRAAQWEWNFQIGRRHDAVDRSDWFMLPQTNDAYNGPLRDIVFPAGFLQPPVFDPAADPAINYGAVGAMIGHELTHGFDDKGRTLDAKGELRDWWTAQDAAQFRARAAKLGSQYSSYEPLPGVHINGELTMGENIADLGGLNVALEAYHRSLNGQPAPLIDGFTGDQRFFLGWAQAWRGKPRDDFIRHQVVSDPHSPRMFRVLGPLRNIDAWYDAFGVKAQDHYYLDPAERVRIW
jgi:putative endopeptidase